jgi:hypothetical protein
MNEANPERREQDPRAVDAGKLAELFYWSAERATAVNNDDVDENMELLSGYLDWRAEQDREMGQELVTAFESYRDPEPTYARLATAAAMQEQANLLRERLGLPPLDVPTEPLPGDTQAQPNWPR